MHFSIITNTRKRLEVLENLLDEMRFEKLCQREMVATIRIYHQCGDGNCEANGEQYLE